MMTNLNVSSCDDVNSNNNKISSTYSNSELSRMLSQVKLLTSHNLQKLASYHPLLDASEECSFHFQELLEQAQQSQDHLKQTISELSVVEGEEKEELLALKTALQGPAFTSLVQQIQELSNRKMSAEKTIGWCELEAAAQCQLLEDLSQQCRQLASNGPNLLLKTKKKMRLYSGITNIKWNYNAPEGELSGFVLRPAKKDVDHFSLDTASNSQYFVTNFLWEQIAANTSDFD